MPSFVCVSKCVRTCMYVHVYTWACLCSCWVFFTSVTFAQIPKPTFAFASTSINLSVIFLCLCLWLYLYIRMGFTCSLPLIQCSTCMQNVFDLAALCSPCSPHRHELHSGSLMLYLSRPCTPGWGGWSSPRGLALLHTPLTTDWRRGSRCLTADNTAEERKQWVLSEPDLLCWTDLLTETSAFWNKFKCTLKKWFTL